MAVEPDRYTILMGLEVRDEVAYSRYRSGMTPILESCGGGFAYDFSIAAVLKGDERINRVFAITFPDRAARARFFEDERYKAVRSEHFEPAVGARVVLAEFESRG